VRAGPLARLFRAASAVSASALAAPLLAAPPAFGAQVGVPGVGAGIGAPIPSDSAAGGSRAADGGEPAPFEILDNSFLLEEAFNQESGVVQNILTWVRARDGAWEMAFTQEWPAGTQRHQLSYTVPWTGGAGATALGHVGLHYRFQLWTETRSRPAAAPRLSLLAPTGPEPAEHGDARWGWQVNLPLSKQWGEVYVHGNAGWTHHPHDKVDLRGPHAGASVIWRARPRWHLLLETIALVEERRTAGVRTRETVAWAAPGARAAWDAGRAQLVVGAAVAIGLADAAHDLATLLYVSYEFPFRSRSP
jgi:hypothetical protein